MNQQERHAKVEWEGQIYELLLQAGQTEEELWSWFSGLAPKMPICHSCGRLFLPGDPYGVGILVDKKTGAEKEILMHLNWECCPSGGFYAGNIGEDGQLILFTVVSLGDRALVIKPGQ